MTAQTSAQLDTLITAISDGGANTASEVRTLLTNLKDSMWIVRTGFAANFTSTNPTLEDNEIGYETDTNQFKVGDGSTAWTSLSYITNAVTSVAGEVGVISATALRAALNVENGAQVNTVDSVAGEVGVVTAPNLRTALNVADGAQVNTVISVAGEVGTISATSLRTAINVTSGAEPNAVDTVAGRTGDVVLATTDFASGTFADARISESSVTQHQAALSIATSQLTGTISGDDVTIGVTTDATTARTLALTDASDVVLMSSSSANTITIPTNAAVAFPNGSNVTVISTGSGVTTIAGDTGVTVSGNGGAASAGSCDIQTQYGAAVLIKVDTNSWIISGDIDTVA